MNLPPILTYVQGCHDRVKPCFGPQDDYYSIFHSPLFALEAHLIFSLLVGILFFLFLGKRKYKRRVSSLFRLGMALLIFLLVFLVAVWLFPQEIVY